MQLLGQSSCYLQHSNRGEGMCTHFSIGENCPLLTIRHAQGNQICDMHLNGAKESHSGRIGGQQAGTPSALSSASITHLRGLCLVSSQPARLVTGDATHGRVQMFLAVCCCCCIYRPAGTLAFHKPSLRVQTFQVPTRCSKQGTLLLNRCRVC